jgi:ribosomal protein S18 acetylase RimI-like enzyme
LKFLESSCSFEVLDEELINSTKFFECSNLDLNDFFQNDCIAFANELMGKTYCFTLDSDSKNIVCSFTISNDSIKTSILPNARKKKVLKNIPSQKRFKSYPAVLIGRLGVSKEFTSLGIGTELLNFIKSWFIERDNKTGCRFIIVDSYNTNEALNFYKKNGFNFLFSSEEQEKTATDVSNDSKIKTRLMYFDLITLYS